MRYHRLNVHWTTHLLRAGIGLVKCEPTPWHTHLYRAWLSFRGNSRYRETPAPKPVAHAIPVVRSGKRSRTGDSTTTNLATFQQARRDAGI